MMLTENKGDTISGYVAVFLLGYAVCAIVDKVPQLRQDKTKLETVQKKVLPQVYSKLGETLKAKKEDDQLIQGILAQPELWTASPAGPQEEKKRPPGG